MGLGALRGAQSPSTLVSRDQTVFKSNSTRALAALLVSMIVLLAGIAMFSSIEREGALNCLKVDAVRTRLVQTESGSVLRLYLRNYCGEDLRVREVRILQDEKLVTEYVNAVVPAGQAIELSINGNGLTSGAATIHLVVSNRGAKNTLIVTVALHK